MSTGIFWPLVAQVGLTVVVTCEMYRRRLTEIRRRRVDPQQLTTRTGAAATLADTVAADNYQNLFEAPVLFFVVCVAIAITGTQTTLEVGLAWLYVFLRALHSLVHLTYNRVVHRFAVFITSGLVLFAIWGLFTYSLLGLTS